jgi:hypothetical protein
VRHPRASPGSLTQRVCRPEGGRSRKSLPFALWFPSPPLLNRNADPMTKGLRASPDRMITPWFRDRQHNGRKAALPCPVRFFSGRFQRVFAGICCLLDTQRSSRRRSLHESDPYLPVERRLPCLIPPGPRKQNSYLCPGRSGWLSGSPFFGEVYRNPGSGRRCIATDAWPAERARSQVIQIRRIAIPIQQFARVFL